MSYRESSSVDEMPKYDSKSNELEKLEYNGNELEFFTGTITKYDYYK